MSSPAQDLSLSLLRLRASAPAVSAGLVHRPRVEKLLTDAARRPVTLVSAGPGYGKTLALASWARHGAAPGVVAWLTLDETDNDLRGFWSDVLGALRIADALPADSACARWCRLPASVQLRPNGSWLALPNFRRW